MYQFEIKNNVLVKVSLEHPNKLNFCVKVPQEVRELSSNLFANSCIGDALAIVLHSGIEKIARDAFNMDTLAFILEEEEPPFITDLTGILIGNPYKQFKTHVWPEFYCLPVEEMNEKLITGFSR